MYKNQLQELAQRSCFNLPSYACIREGPDHAPRFKASVNFNGEIFESPTYCTTLRQAEHAAAEVALNALSARGPSRSLTARVLDETGVYKNLLQETAHRAGLDLPLYTTIRTGPGHVPVFTSTVELAGMSFTGESAKTKKQAEKNAAIAAWSSLKRMPNLDSLSHTSKEVDNRDDKDRVIVGRVLSNLGRKDEFRVIRRRDQNQPKNRMQRTFRDNAPNTSGSSQQQWRLMDLFSDTNLENSRQKQHSFLSLLPPPPPRTVSKILPPSLSTNCPAFYQTESKPASTQIMGNSQVKLQEISHIVERDEDELLHRISKAIKKPIEMEGSSNYGANAVYKSFAVPNSGKPNISLHDQIAENARTHIRTSLFGLTTPAIKGSTSTCRQRVTFTGGRTAPAVQIRSVIPVCAAPPPHPVILRPSSSSKESASPSALSSAFSKLNL
ncbi:double-stranded RNA-binding protein 3-like [Forsythia ovata]|uniref:Double-stranded RNA-binding protein 3-like n=1 Tax=Forsythia ovata TaxID=205694 RepID=A0ABD1WSH9_9LAMI